MMFTSRSKLFPIRKNSERSPVVFVKPKEKEKYVYFVVVGDTVKIGVTNNIDIRMGSIKTHQSRPIDAAYVDDNKVLSEQTLHKKFSKHRLQGEWFDLSEEIKGYISMCLLTAMLRLHFQREQKGN